MYEVKMNRALSSFIWWIEDNKRFPRHDAKKESELQKGV